MARLVVLMPTVMAVSACGGGGTATPAPATAAQPDSDAETAASEASTTPEATAEGATASASGGNWLIGRWRPVDPDCTTYQEVSFTPESYTVVVGPAGWNPGAHTAAVSYTVSAEEAWMQTSGNSFRRFPIDADHFRDDDEKACIWQRVS